MNIELVEVEIMLDQIIKNCLDQMQEKNLIMEDNREYYQYAMELLVEESLTDNASWQGQVTWADKNITKNFRSTLELIKLMDGAITPEETKNS